MKFSTNHLRFPLIAAALLTAGTMQAQVFATGVHSFNQGPRADGVSPIGVTRSNADNALGNININDKNIGEVANNSASVEFVSLGYGGELVLEFSTPICNGAGMDLKVWETSYGTPSHASWPERALVEARQHDCQPWTSLGLITQDAELDLGALSSAKYIRITDMTDPSFPAFSSANQDAFDVDAVVGYSGCPDPGVADKFSPNEVVSITPAFRKNGSLMAEGPNRRVQSKMLGAPQMSDVTTPEANVNFFTAGFAGEIVLKFPYTIFGTAGADLNVYETTFGDNASRKCSNYPELAEFYGSADGSTWFPLNAIVTLDLVGGAPNDGGAAGANVLCRDGQLSIGAGNAINYIKLVDVSHKPSTYFPGSADGYDLDGIVGRCYGQQNSPKLTAETSIEEEIGEGVFGISVYPNPAAATDAVKLNVSAVNLKSEYVIRIFDMTGRVVSSEVVNSSKGSFEHLLNVAVLPTGIYAVTVETNGMTEIVKLVKN